MSNNKVKIGFSEKKITPDIPGMRLDGYGFRQTLPAEGVRDDLHLRVAAFEGGGKRFAVVAIEICGLSERLYNDITDHITALSGLAGSDITICSVHTHSGPVCGVLAELPIDYPYWAWIGETAGRAVCEAFENAVPCIIDSRFGMGEMTFAANRRNREIVDKRILVSSFFDETGTLRGVICSASVHPVINTTMKISADYPSFLTQAAAEKYPGVPFIFIQGRGADVNNKINSEDVEERLKLAGTALADSVLGAVAVAFNAEKVLPKGISGAFGKFKIRMKPYSAPDILREEITNEMRSLHSLPEGDKAKRFSAVRRLNYKRDCLEKSIREEVPELDIPLQILEIENALIFAAVPFELFTSTGNKIEEILKACGYKSEQIIVAGYSNSVNGYLVPAEELPYGGYEINSAPVWYGLPFCSEHSETDVIEAFKTLAEV